MNQKADSQGQYQRAVQSSETALSAELSLTRASGADEVAAQAALFRDRVDGLQVSETPLAWINMSTVAAAALLRNEGVDAVPMVTCRDRNRVGLMSDLLGLRALGVSSVLLGRGRRLGKKHALHSSAVFDMTGRELIALAASMNEEEGLAGQPFFIGTGSKAHRARAGWSAESLAARADAGAQFVQTQICYNVDLLKQWLERLVEAQMTWRYSVIVSITPFATAKTARWVKDEMLDSKIPDQVIERLEEASDPEQEGIAICAETMREIAALPGVSGIHLMSTGSPDLLTAALDASGLRPAG